MNESAQIGYRKIVTDYTGIPFDDPNYSEFSWLNISNMIFTETSDKQALLCMVYSYCKLFCLIKFKICSRETQVVHFGNSRMDGLF